MEARDIFPERVERRLKELGWTQSDLARSLQVGPKGISKVLQERRAPRIDTLLKWADALQVPPGWLLGREDAPSPKKVATKAEIEALLTMAAGLGFSEERLKLIRFALNARETLIGVTLDGLPEKWT